MDRDVLLVAYVALNVVMACLAITVVRSNRKRVQVWPSTLLLFLVHYWLYFALVPALQISTSAFGPYHAVSPLIAFTRTWFASTAFLWAVLIGYIWINQPRCAPAGLPERPQPLPAAVFATITSVLVCVYAYSFTRFFDQGLAYYLANIGNRIQLSLGKGYFLWGLTLSLAAALYFVDRLIAGSRHRADVIAGVAWAAIAVATQALLGLRARTFFLVLILLLLTAYRRRTSLSRAGVFASVFLATGLLWGSIRHGGWEANRGDVDVDMHAIAENARASLGVAEVVGILTTRVEPQDYRYGGTLLAALTMPIPRAIWPGKPNGSGPDASNIISPGIYQLGGENSTGITISLLGEAWFNFGPFGIPLVGVVYGLLLGATDRRLRRLLVSPTDMRLGPWVAASYFLTVSVLVGEFAGAVMGAAMSIAPYSILVAIERRSGRWLRRRHVLVTAGPQDLRTRHSPARILPQATHSSNKA